MKKILNETDIYMRLIDNKEADRILKIFNINITTNDLGLKKINILKIFRGQVNSRKKRINPFYRAIVQHQNPKLKDRYSSEEEFFEVLSRITNDKLPDYKKFANALLYYPDKTKEILPSIEENIRNNRPIFYNSIKLETIEDYKEYFIKRSKFNKDDFIDKYIQSIHKYIKLEDTKQFTEYCNDIEKWNIKDLYNNISYENKKNDQILKGYIAKYAYLKMHPNEDLKLRQALLMQILFEILYEQKLKIDYFTQERSNQVKEFKERDYEEKIILLKKKNDEICKQNIKLKNKFYNQKEEYNKKTKKLDEENKKIKKINDEFKKELVNQKEQDYKRIESLEEEKQKILTKIKEQDFYNELAFSVNNQENLFAVIYSIDICVCKRIFPEVLFVSKGNLNNGLNDICNKKIGHIYIQRNGISSKFIAEIESFCMTNNIQSKVFIAKNEKELIENISMIKNKIRSDF